MASGFIEHVIVDLANSNSSNNTVTASTRFRWDKEQKVENLMIRCLANCKAKMEFLNKQYRQSSAA